MTTLSELRDLLSDAQDALSLGGHDALAGRIDRVREDLEGAAVLGGASVGEHLDPDVAPVDHEVSLRYVSGVFLRGSQAEIRAAVPACRLPCFLRADL